jgi:hypothetical protein
MKLLYLFFLLISFSSVAQDLEYLKAQDTIYIILKDINGNVTKRENFNTFRMESWGNDKVSDYKIIDSQNRIIGIEVLKNMNYPGNFIVTRRKKFFKKNKNKIITLDFIKKYEPKHLFIDVLGTFHSKKIFYVIDEESINRKDKEIILRKTSIVPVFYTEM